ncbi:MAG: hypothetical protein ACK4TA_24955 [Saprospiraceae bacterium]
MNKDIQRFDAIQNYLDNKMSAEERATFEADLASDEDLAAEVGAHRLEREMMDILLEDDLDAQMESWKQEKTQVQVQQPRRPRWWVWGILALAVVALLLYLLQNSSKNTTTSPAPDTQQLDNSTPPENNTPSNEAPEAPAKKKYNGPVADSEKKSTENAKQPQTELMALATEFAGTPEFAGTLVRSAEDATTRFDSASVLIQEKRYDQAIRLLQSIPNDEPEVYLNARLNLGYLYFLQRNYKAAISPLTTAAQNPDYLFTEAAQWYLTLAYIGNSQKTEALQLLKLILADQQHIYYTKAQQLEKRLR